MKIFLINLKKQPERLQRMESVLTDLGLEFEVIEAIDGSSIENIDEYVKYPDQSIKHLGRSLTEGEVGCILSHRKAYSEIINRGLPCALILEDDISFSSEFIEFLNYFKNISIDFDTLLLGYHGISSRNILDLKYLPLIKTNNVLEIGLLQEPAYGAYGYIVSILGAKKLLKLSDDFIRPIDHYTGNPELNKALCSSKQLIKIYEKHSDNSILTIQRQAASAKVKYPSLIKCIKNHMDSTTQNIVIYGLNDLGYHIYSAYKNRIKLIIDRDKKGQNIEGIKILDFEQVEVEQLNKLLVIVTIMNPEVLKTVVNNLKKKINNANIITLIKK